MNDQTLWGLLLTVYVVPFWLWQLSEHEKIEARKRLYPGRSDEERHDRLLTRRSLVWCGGLAAILGAWGADWNPIGTAVAVSVGFVAVLAMRAAAGLAATGWRMRGLLWRLFPPFEVRLTLEETRALMAQTGMCRAIVEPRVTALVRDAEKTVYSVRIERVKPDQLALLLFTNVLGEELSSGKYHVYRGTLNMVGKDLLNTWYAVQKALVARGYCTEAEMDQDNEWIKRQINDAG